MSRLSLIIADAIALALALAIIVLFRRLLFGPLPPLHWGLWSTAAAWFLFRGASELFTPYGLYPPEELRRSFRTSSAALVIHCALLIASGSYETWRLFGLLIWPLSLPLTYTCRTFIRSRLIALKQYGAPVAVIGNGLAARRAIRELLSRPELGYVPVAVFTTERAEANETRDLFGVPLVGRADAAGSFEFPYHVSHALLAVGTGWADERNHQLAQQLARRYPHLQIFSNLVGQGHWLARARPLGPYVAIETRHARFTWHQRLLKRAMDIAICLPALILASPLILIAGIGIYAADPGPIFFSQTREGRRGKPIKIYKLRSMVVGAEAKLAAYLAKDEMARFEYERTMKLRNDPRIIPGVGKIIRKASIDELPQLWSIIKGDMSLVGPRVMPTREVDLYSEEGRDLRRDMLPGLTGFWQVEHRNDSDFRVRELADSFYVANWSVWLDLWIVLRTVRVVLTGAGAF
ncbi:exopolysaccharide biosynthesis polyprenyl glycosylphosphotransferase [Sphingomonas piscis]|uniref:Exopolysaccharide biosynthesis polyprenyl glycosylphosphotransferase n=1 Tax=Sphingomonas piscis TaxID=2714943 RepID=A0A6G7YRT7_9SPHN|nr:exopolysaccharide biosynthesis polyprenyl glycosylphosphotransferase [Sphingomonas piscis]QIK79449.1 exopolysaccharide biosynthesis polyprenyl glycosylphosphotransferase [Sphingomonas piscis]